MSVTIKQVYDWIDTIAPFEGAEEWDNVGILAGSADQKVEKVLCALDLNAAVLDEAIARNVQLIVTHHPILFAGRKNMREDDAEGRLICALIRNKIGLIAAHTNFDNANPGVNDVLAEKLGLSGVEVLECGMRIGTPKEKVLGYFAKTAENALGGPVRCYGKANRIISKVAVLGGAGGSFAGIALENGADVYLTGEISHHRAWDAYAEGMCCLEAGHAATEMPAVNMLADALQKMANDVQCNVQICASEVELFR
ncbi:MAG: Nif3-like dinuclear metal center hexameric protein [Clostridia bacterium]|nr:Nif3-like dinuclear metal center hexameric protein [Clostridia bacterium]